MDERNQRKRSNARSRAPAARRWRRGTLLLLCLALIAIGWKGIRAADTTRLPSVDGPALTPQPDTPSGPSLNDKLRQRGDLTLSQTTLRQALFTIGETWQVNLVVGEDVSGNVNGVFKNAPLHEILHSILYANGYGYRVVGQGLVVMKLDSLGDANPLFETSAIALRGVKPEDVVEGANLLKSPQGKVTAIPSARTLMVVDLPERIEAIRNFVTQVDERVAGAADAPADVQRKIAQYAPQYVKALSLKESLEAILSKEGKAVVIEAENRVVVVDYPSNLLLADHVVKQLDQPRPQVRITALIYDVSLEDLERLGINWNHAVKANNTTANGLPESAWAIDTLTLVPAAAGTPSGSMTFLNLSRNFDIRAAIEALCQSKDAQLLADPSVTVVDREPATMQIVTEIPYQQLTQTQQGGNIGTTAFREAGVTLKVVPHIAKDGTVQMEVTPTFSRLTGFTNGQNPQPIIDKREANTTVRVVNQQWLVIGGLRQRTAVKDDRAIPKLGTMKHFGKLFQAYDYSYRESELIVFLRPETITPEYVGREREQEVLGASEPMLDEVPVAPHVLGPGEVGCPACGKQTCQGCQGCVPKLRRMMPKSRRDEPECEECTAQAQPTPAARRPPLAAPYPPRNSPSVRRLPPLEAESVAVQPTVVRPAAPTLPGPPLAAPTKSAAKVAQRVDTSAAAKAAPRSAATSKPKEARTAPKPSPESEPKPTRTWGEWFQGK